MDDERMRTFRERADASATASATTAQLLRCLRRYVADEGQRFPQLDTPHRREALAALAAASPGRPEDCPRDPWPYGCADCMNACDKRTVEHPDRPDLAVAVDAPNKVHPPIPATCPHCGADLSKDQSVRLWLLEPIGRLARVVDGTIEALSWDSESADGDQYDGLRCMACDREIDAGSPDTYPPVEWVENFTAREDDRVPFGPDDFADDRWIVRHCPDCGGDGIDPVVKTDEGKVARGEYAVTCCRCHGSGHVIEMR